jgi:hypothetical protein
MGSDVEPGAHGPQDPVLVRRGRRLRCAPGRRRRARVEHHGRRVAGADAVDEAVVGLGRERPAAVLEALEQHAAPQRARAVEAVRVEVSGPRQQLVLPTRRGQRGAGHVDGDVEVGVVLPLRAPEAAGRATREPLAVARKAVEALQQVGPQLIDGRRRPVEDEDPADVHVRAAVAVLELEERRVERGQRLAHGRL